MKSRRNQPRRYCLAMRRVSCTTSPFLFTNAVRKLRMMSARKEMLLCLNTQYDEHGTFTLGRMALLGEVRESYKEGRFRTIALAVKGRETLRGRGSFKVDWCCNSVTSCSKSNFHASYESYGCPLLFAIW